MKKLTVFYLEDCPYCVKARNAVDLLRSENRSYEEVVLEWVEEARQPEIADRYNYYYVPSIFCGEKKLYECSPADDESKIKQHFQAAFKYAAECSE